MGNGRQVMTSPSFHNLFCFTFLLEYPKLAVYPVPSLPYPLELRHSTNGLPFAELVECKINILFVQEVATFTWKHH